MKKAWIVYLSIIGLFAVILTCAVIFSHDKYLLPYPNPAQSVENDIYYLDLNAATAEQLTPIPGVGPALAQNIIEYREEHGPFTQYGELLNVKGIGHEKIKVIMEYVRIK